MTKAMENATRHWTEDFFKSLAADILTLTTTPSTANTSDGNTTTTTTTTTALQENRTTSANNSDILFNAYDGVNFYPDITSLGPILYDAGITDDSRDDAFLPWDNPHNVISLQTFLSFEKAMTCGVNVVLFLVGVPLNVLNAIVFYRQGLKDRMNLCLFCQALVDMLYIVFMYLVSSYCLAGVILGSQEDQDQGHGFSVEWFKYSTRTYFVGLYRGFLYASGCLTAIISLERCVCVMQPLKFPTLIRTRTMGIVIAVIVGGLQLAAVLYPLEFDIGSRVHPVTGDTTLFLSATKFYYDNKMLYTVVEDNLLMVVIPFSTFIIVTVSTTVTVLELRLRHRWRLAAATSAGAGHGQVGLVKMLVVVSSIYILTAAPNVALGLVRVLVPEFRYTKRYANIFLFSHLFYLELAMFNSSINFFVYVTRSSRFRAHLVAMCGRTTALSTAGATSGDATNTCETTIKTLRA